MRRLVGWIAATFDKRDAVILIGLALVTWGAWMIEPIAAPIVAGVVLLYVALFWKEAK